MTLPRHKKLIRSYKVRTRDNVVMQVVSSLIARARGAFHKFSDEVEQVTLSIDLEDFVERVTSPADTP